MIKNKIKISAVEFLNTLPFRYGMDRSKKLKENADISYDIPSECASKLLNDEVDIGLVPIETLSRMSDYHIITEFCIGAGKKVDSVYLFGDVPKEEMDYILLDYRSRTSVNLVKILAENLWNIKPEYQKGAFGYERNIIQGTGGVVIGDKALELVDNYRYSYDLAEEWYRFTGEEFVFAAWVSKTKPDDYFLDIFSDALKKGINNIDKVLEDMGAEYTHLPARFYLKNRISYKWNQSKQNSMNLYLNYLKKIRMDF